VAWQGSEGRGLGKTVARDGPELTILRATGLLVDLSRVKNIYDALDQRGYEVFSLMFEGPGSPELAAELQEELTHTACSWAVSGWPPRGAGTALSGC